MTTFFVAEHLWSEYNQLGLVAGQDPQPLLPGSRRLARELVGQQFGQWLAFSHANYGFPTAVFCPSTLRHRESAEIAFGQTGVPLVVDARLNPVDAGEYVGKEKAVVRAAGGVVAFVDRAYPGGESYRQVAARFQSFLLEVTARYPEEIVLIGGAAGSTRQMLAHHCYGYPLELVVQKAKFYAPEALLACGCNPSVAPYRYPRPRGFDPRVPRCMHHQLRLTAEPGGGP